MPFASAAFATIFNKGFKLLDSGGRVSINYRQLAYGLHCIEYPILHERAEKLPTTKLGRDGNLATWVKYCDLVKGWCESAILRKVVAYQAATQSFIFGSLSISQDGFTHMLKVRSGQQQQHQERTPYLQVNCVRADIAEQSMEHDHEHEGEMEDDQEDEEEDELEDEMEYDQEHQYL